MNMSMVTLGHNSQILKAIVQSVVIEMMYFFLSFKIAAKMRFHHEPVLKHVTLISEWMIRLVNPTITKCINPSTALPIWMGRASQMFILRGSHSMVGWRMSTNIGSKISHKGTFLGVGSGVLVGWLSTATKTNSRIHLFRLGYLFC